MNAYIIIILILSVLLVVALAILYNTRKRLKEMECFQSIKEPGEDADEGVIGSFGK